MPTKINFKKMMMIITSIPMVCAPCLGTLQPAMFRSK